VGGWRHSLDRSREKRVGRRRRKEEKRGDLGSREEEQDTKAQDIQDTDEQQQCIVSRCSSLYKSFVTLEVRAKTY